MNFVAECVGGAFAPPSFFFFPQSVRGNVFCYFFSLHSCMDCEFSAVLKPAKLIQNLGGVLWLAFSLKDNPAHSLAHTLCNHVQHKLSPIGALTKYLVVTVRFTIQ